MNKEEEVLLKKMHEIWPRYTTLDNMFGLHEKRLILEAIKEYAQQVKQELFKKIESQKFFHALPPTAKDEYYEFVKNQQ